MEKFILIKDKKLKKYIKKKKDKLNKSVPNIIDTSSQLMNKTIEN